MKRILPPESKPEISVALSRSFSGPLPPPETLARYDDILPGAAERILRMAEKQMEHRHSIEANVVGSNVDQQKRGPVFGFIIAMTSIIGGIYLLVIGKDAGGLAAILTPIAGIVWVFVLGKREQKEDLETKEKSLSGN